MHIAKKQKITPATLPNELEYQVASFLAGDLPAVMHRAHMAAYLYDAVYRAQVDAKNEFLEEFDSFYQPITLSNVPHRIRAGIPWRYDAPSLDPSSDFWNDPRSQMVVGSRGWHWDDCEEYYEWARRLVGIATNNRFTHDEVYYHHGDPTSVFDL